MRLTERQIGTATVLELRGALAGTRAVETFDAAIHRLCRLGTSKVVADLGRIRAIDLAGLGALVDAHRALRQHGSGFALARLTARLHDLVVMTRLLTVFETHDSVEAALGSAPVSADMSRVDVSPTTLGMITRFLRRA
jgi:anti-sigma B factor antagonist